MNKYKILIVANWKMNPGTIEEANKIFLATDRISRNLKNIRLVICPPYIYLSELEALKSRTISLGAQDAFMEKSGSFTGEISPNMLKAEGEKYVIIGHSERRELGETHELISRKVLTSLRAGLKVILCVGERERDGHGEYLSFLRSEIVNSLNKVGKRYINSLIIAYEPIWAIGRGDTASLKPGDLHEITIFIKKILCEIYGPRDGMTVPILYGGSVNFKNAKELVVGGGVKGLLVGRESLRIERFEKLLLSVD